MRKITKVRKVMYKMLNLIFVVKFNLTYTKPDENNFDEE